MSKVDPVSKYMQKNYSKTIQIVYNSTKLSFFTFSLKMHMLKKMKKREKAKKICLISQIVIKSQFSGIRTVKSTCLIIKKALNIQEKTLFT